MAIKISPKQMEALRDYAEGYEHPCLDDYFNGGAGSLAFGNRDRVIGALRRRGLVDDNGITDAGRDVLAGRAVNTDSMGEAQFATLVR